MSLPLAHGIGGVRDLPVPGWLFYWGAAIVLVVSFVALSALWQRPLLAQASPAQRQRLQHHLENGRLSRAELAGAVQDSGSLEYARRRAEDLAAAAAAELDCLPPSEAREILHLLTERVVHREA